MAVRPLNGLVSVAECDSRFEADTAVARLAASGIEAVVIGDPAHSVAPHLVTEHAFSVLVRIAIADDAQQALVRPPSTDPEPSHLVHPSLRPRGGLPSLPLGADLDGGDADRDGHLLEDDASGGPVRRARWITVLAWATLASLVLPLVAGAAQALGQL